MKTGQRTVGLLRAGAIISMLAVLLSGVTFAALRSQNDVITGSHMTSASANLQMSKGANAAYASSMPGYDFFDLSPGGNAGPIAGNDLYLKNFGSTTLELKVSLNPARLINLNGVDLHHTYLVVFEADTNTQLVKLSLADLSSAYTISTPLTINEVIGGNIAAHLQLRMQLDDSATTSLVQVEMQNLDFVFSGQAL